MQQERRVGRAARDRPVHVVDRKIAHARPARMASTSAWSAGLSTSIAGERVAHLDRCGSSRPSLRPIAAALWSIVRSRSTAPSSNAGPSAASSRQPFLRSCSTDRHSSIAGSDLRASRTRTGSRRCRRRRGSSSQVRLVCGKRAQQRPAFDHADREIRAFRLGGELGDHRRVEQRMIGGRDQHRQFARLRSAISSAIVAAIVPRDARMLTRAIVRQHRPQIARGPASGR